MQEKNAPRDVFFIFNKRNYLVLIQIMASESSVQFFKGEDGMYPACSKIEEQAALFWAMTA